MEVLVTPDPLRAAHLVCDEIERLLARTPKAVLGLATGATPLATYAELVKRRARGQLDLSGVTVAMLDEYVGVAATDPCSYRAFLLRELVTKAGIPERAVLCPDGSAPDAARSCTRYEDSLRQVGGVDLQLLGIGRNGHIGFNEPGSSLASRTRIKALAPTTRADNARHFPSGQAIPTHAVTMGIGTILEARQLVLLATGQSKAPAVRAALEGPVTSQCPASAIQLHPRVTVVLDEAAASRLSLREYHLQCQGHREAAVR